MRHYPGRQPGIVATIDLPAYRGVIESTAEAVYLSVDDAAQWLETYAESLPATESRYSQKEIE